MHPRSRHGAGCGRKTKLTSRRISSTDRRPARVRSIPRLRATTGCGILSPVNPAAVNPRAACPNVTKRELRRARNPAPPRASASRLAEQRTSGPRAFVTQLACSIVLGCRPAGTATSSFPSSASRFQHAPILSRGGACSYTNAGELESWPGKAACIQYCVPMKPS